MTRKNLNLYVRHRTRTLTEHVLTLAIWALWLWSVSRASLDWQMILFKAPTLPIALEAGVVVSLILLLILWHRAYYSLAPDRPMPLQFKLDPQAEQKCLALVGWNPEKQALAQQTQCFDVSTGREDLKCQISMPSDQKDTSELKIAA